MEILNKFNDLYYGDISNDPIAVQMNALARVSTRINTLQAEIAALKSLQ